MASRICKEIFIFTKCNRSVIVISYFYGTVIATSCNNVFRVYLSYYLVYAFWPELFNVCDVQLAI